MWNEPHDTLAVFVLDDFENRLERSNNHVPRWETNGVFFALNQTIHGTGKVSYARFHMLFGFPPASGQESVTLACPHCRL